jgi:putative ABC transport system permease protein
MIRNYLTIAWRNLKRHKIFSLINVLGLAIGMAACLLILQYVSFELSFDRYHTKAPDIYRVVNDRYQNGKLIQHGTITYSAVGKAMKDDFPEIFENTRVEPQNEMVMAYGKRKTMSGGLHVDPSFLRMFTVPFLAGNPANALDSPYSIVLTESTARNLLGFQGKDWKQWIGKSITINQDAHLYQITGVCQDSPENTHLPFSTLISYSTLFNRWKDADHSFTQSDFWHYVQLRPGTDERALNAKLDAFSQRHFQGNKVSGSVEKFYLQPLLKAHLYSDFEYEIGVIGNGTVVWGLLIIAVFIMVIAWVNYINLATARAMERAKEVGIRKVVGARKAQLIAQFLAESFLLNFIALVLAITLVQFAQPSFNALLDLRLSLSLLLGKGWGGLNMTIGLLTVMLCGIFLSGFYPAFVLSAFRPVLVLKGKYSASRRGILLRKGLVIGQFAATVALIAGSFVVFRQVRFMSEKELGFNMDQMLVVSPPRLTPWDSTFYTKIISFKEEIKGIASVKGAATSGRFPGQELGRAFNVRQAGTDKNTYYTIRQFGASYDFIDVYGMRLLAGRKLTPVDHNLDGKLLRTAILNETAIKQLGFASPQAAIGQSILIYDKSWEVVGVIADFHQKSLRSPMEPTVIVPSYGTWDPISVKVNVENIAQTMAAIKEKYEAFFPGNAFDYVFLDEQFNRQYKTDRLFGKVFGLFSGLAIFVACLGLFGLSLFTTAQRTKEIGVRKVLGASIPNILLLLSKDFLQLVLLANLLALPLAWWAIHRWLQGYAYKIDIQPWLFVIPALLVLLIALFTVSFQTLKAARQNPIRALRYE